MTPRAPRGTFDILPDDIDRWRALEAAVRSVCSRYGYEEIRTPILEETRLFQRAVGTATDIVEKQMFTFDARERLETSLRRRLCELNPGTSRESDIEGLIRVTGEAFRSHQAPPDDRGLPADPAAVDTVYETFKDAEGRGLVIPTHRELLDLFVRARENALCLRPEITAPVVRALLEHNLLRRRRFWKLFYIGPAFRKERPQKGRFRQFHQFGIEAIGSADPMLDAESILLLADILLQVGIRNFEVRLGTLGCLECRAPYRRAVRGASRANEKGFCPTCRNRMDQNVLRIFDCKNNACRELAADLPRIRTFLCDPCRRHDEAVQQALAGRVPVRLDDRLVRGLDYYTRTVYEFTSPDLGAQDALGGGGRYDHLVAELGGPSTPATGFAAGMERILLAAGAGTRGPARAARMDVYGVSVNPEHRRTVFELVAELRRRGFSGSMDFEGRSLKAQLRSAHKLGARFAVIVGPEEARRGRFRLKPLREEDESMKEQEVEIDEAVRILDR